MTLLYNQFGDGFNTPALQAAKALLTQLASADHSATAASESAST